MDLHRLGVKLFAQEPAELDLAELIRVFHSWIQARSFDDHLLLDVHDYSHVSMGPGILLVAHQGNFSWDLAGNRSGLLYYRKQSQEGDTEEQLGSIFGTALKAAQLLENSPLGVHFRTDELLLVSNDRLHAPNTEATFQGFQSELAPTLNRLLGGQPFRLVQQVEPGGRFALAIHSVSSEPVGTLLKRIEHHAGRLIV